MLPAVLIFFFYEYEALQLWFDKEAHVILAKIFLQYGIRVEKLIFNKFEDYIIERMLLQAVGTEPCLFY